MKYNPAIHHRRSIRLKGYDYSRAGRYFITICTWDKQHYFGDVVKGEMVMSRGGVIAKKCWVEIPEHFPNVVLHNYIIMPNHVHGIIELIHVDDHQHPKFIRREHKFQKIIPRSVGSIVRGYKIGVTKWIRENTKVRDVWQQNYHEHIIRNQKSYLAISHYISNNPATWENDQFNK